MTPHERMLRAIARQPVDRFCVSTYNLHPFKFGEHWGDPGYQKILDKVASSGAACLCKIAAEKRLETSELEVRQKRDLTGLYTTTIWNTPAGSLRQTTFKPTDQPPMCVEAFVKDEEDLQRYLSVEYLPMSWDVSTVVSNAREIGESGIAYISYDDPFYLISDLFDQEDFAVRVLTDFELMQYLVRRQFERTYQDLKILLDILSPMNVPLLFYTAGPERATPPLQSPDTFNRLIIPFQSPLVDLIHDYGYSVSLHCHGRVREVLPSILDCGFDVLEPIEPPPQGNIALEKLMATAGKDITLMGYMQDQEFYTFEEREIRDSVRRIADIAGGATGYICCPTCTPFQHPPTDTYVQNYVAFLDEAASL